MKRSLDWTLVGAGFLLLFVSAFVDNARGPLLPVIAREMGVTYGRVGLFLVVGQVASIPVAILLTPLLRAYGEVAVARGISLLAMATCLAASLVGSFPALLGFAAVLGGTITMLGTASNVLVIRGTPAALLGRMLSGLHMMYGVGSLLAPLAATAILSGGWRWQSVFAVAAPVALADAVLLTRRRRSEPVVPVAVRAAPPGRPWRHAAVLAIFGSYAAGEVLCSMWLVSYVLAGPRLTREQGAVCLTGFFGLLALSRLASAVLVPRRWERRALWLSLGLATLALLAGQWHSPWLLPLAGLCGPCFPLLLAGVGRAYPDEWRDLTVWIMVAVQASLSLAHGLMGLAADAFGIVAAFRLAPLLWLLTAALLFRVRLKEPSAA